MRKWNTVEDLLQELDSLDTGGRDIERVIVHHTWSPSHAEWDGDSSAEGVKAFWLDRQVQEGWQRPPGGHFMVAPNGSIYAPFDDLSIALNANSDLEANQVGVAIETVGNFDVGHDVLAGEQHHALLGLVGGLLALFHLNPASVFFHRSFPAAHKTCPGTSLDLHSIRLQAAMAQAWAAQQMANHPSTG